MKLRMVIFPHGGKLEMKQKEAFSPFLHQLK
jgi:hypothetical protein